MIRPRTLRSRIVLYFCGYLAVLLTLYSGGIISIFNLSEDLAFNRQVAEIAANIADHVRTHGELPAALPLHITAYLSLAEVPSAFREFVKGRGPGPFEINTADLDCHVEVLPIAATNQALYVIFDVGSIEKSDQFESFWTLALTFIGLGVLLTGGLLARSLAKGILTPISDLAAEVEALSLDRGSTIRGVYTTPDEVGTLAATLDQLLQRIGEFTRREREFTAHASHELRTPVTVIKGAMEILKGRTPAQDPKVQAPLMRIQRALTDIEMLIDTFLLLARQDEIPDMQETCDLEVAARDVVAAHHYLLADKPVTATIRTVEPGMVQAPASLVTIALGNLVRNAFRYTLKGRVDVWVLADRVRVWDTGPGIDAAPQGLGLGLTIVERLCERMEWRFTVHGPRGEGTRAELVFHRPDSADPAPAAA